MSPEQLRDAARALYEAHAPSLGLDAWRAASWRDAPPSSKQRAALAKVAGTDLSQFTDEEAVTVRAIAVRPDAAGRGAVHDCLAVTFGLYARMKGDTRPQRKRARPMGGQVAPLARGDAELRLSLVEAILEAPSGDLEAVASVLGRR